MAMDLLDTNGVPFAGGFHETKFAAGERANAFRTSQAAGVICGRA
jgi:hypothetical protein